MAYLDVHADEVREPWQGNSTETLIEVKEQIIEQLSKIRGEVLDETNIHSMMNLQQKLIQIDRELTTRRD
jgi:hypothetical protein